MIYIIILIIIISEIIWSPRLDKTIEGDLLLWYNKNKHREYIKLN